MCRAQCLTFHDFLHASQSPVRVCTNNIGTQSCQTNRILCDNTIVQASGQARWNTNTRAKRTFLSFAVAVASLTMAVSGSTKVTFDKLHHGEARSDQSL